VLPLKNRAKKLVNVIIPSPPVWIRIEKTMVPYGVSVDDISTGVSPDTHTALVERNRESVNVRFPVLHFGISNISAPTNIRKRKLTAIINVGLVLLLSVRISIEQTVSMEYAARTITKYHFEYMIPIIAEKLISGDSFNIMGKIDINIETSISHLMMRLPLMLFLKLNSRLNMMLAMNIA